MKKNVTQYSTHSWTAANIQSLNRLDWKPEHLDSRDEIRPKEARRTPEDRKVHPLAEQWRASCGEDASTDRLPANAPLPSRWPEPPAISHFSRDKRPLNLIVLMPVIKVAELVRDCSTTAARDRRGWIIKKILENFLTALLRNPVYARRTIPAAGVD